MKEIKKAKTMMFADIFCICCWVVALVLELKSKNTSTPVVVIYAICAVTFLISAIVYGLKVKKLKSEN